MSRSPTIPAPITTTSAEASPSNGRGGADAASCSIQGDRHSIGSATSRTLRPAMIGCQLADRPPARATQHQDDHADELSAATPTINAMGALSSGSAVPPGSVVAGVVTDVVGASTVVVVTGSNGPNTAAIASKAGFGSSKTSNHSAPPNDPPVLSGSGGRRSVMPQVTKVSHEAASMQAPSASGVGLRLERK